MFGKHKRALEHIAKLEAAIADQDKQLQRIESGKELVEQANYSQILPILGGPTAVFHEPPKKKPEPYVPILDETYFEHRRPAFGFYSPSVYHYATSGYPYAGSASYYGGASMTNYPPYPFPPR